MPKRKNRRRSKQNKKKASTGKKTARRNKPTRTKRSAAKKSPTARVTLEKFGGDAQEALDDLTPDIGGTTKGP